jgi:hypothetical protein
LVGWWVGGLVGWWVGGLVGWWEQNDRLITSALYELKLQDQMVRLSPTPTVVLVCLKPDQHTTRIMRHEDCRGLFINILYKVLIMIEFILLLFDNTLYTNDRDTYCIKIHTFYKGAPKSNSLVIPIKSPGSLLSHVSRL